MLSDFAVVSVLRDPELVSACTRHLIIAAVYAAACATVLQAGLPPETGSSVLKLYSVNDYGSGAGAQDWSSVQDSRGIMYFANPEGVLQFDGTLWKLIPTGGRNPATRALAVDAKGVVYVGGVGDFGFLQPDSSGTLKFVSLVDRVSESDRKFNDVPNVVATGDGVYFRSDARLLRLNADGSVKVWKPASRFGWIFSAFNSLYVKTPEQGLAKLQGDQFLPVPGGEAFRKDAADITASTRHGQSQLLATLGHLYRLTDSGVQLIETAADAFFAKNAIRSMLVMQGNEIAIGTRRGGMALIDLDNNGSIDRVISKENGLPSDYVTSLLRDRQGGVWLTTLSGIARLNPGLSSFGKSEDLQGDTEAMVTLNGVLYAGTTSGLFRLRPVAGMSPHFEHVEGIADTVWTLLPHGNDLLATTSHGIFLVSNDKARSILETGSTVSDICVSLRDPQLLYTATAKGVFALQQQGQDWVKVGEASAPGVQFRSVLEDPDGTVWAATKGGIWHIDFRKQPVAVERFGQEQNVPANWINVRSLAGHIVFTTEKGLRSYSAAKKRMVPDLTLGEEFPDGRNVFNTFEDSTGNVWVTGPGYHGILRGGKGSYRWEAMPLQQSGIKEIYWMFPDKDGVVWAAGEEKQLFRWDPALAGNPDAGFRVLTRQIDLTDKMKTLYGGEGPLNSVRLPYGSTDLTFRFAAPFFEDPASVEYQVKLEGNDRDWSRWAPATSKEYSYLSEGNYRLQLRARSPHGTVSEQSDISFGVSPPWFRTWWAYSIYLICFSAVIWGAVRWRTRQLEEDKRQLENIVEERTVEIREQRDEIQVQERKSHSLLLNILPATVADELKATGEVQPVGFDDVTVCFTDFVGFTLSSEKLAPGKLVAALNEYFTAFDEIVARYGLEKLKTIGDSYMFASGLPMPRKSHAVDAVLAALEMVEVVKRLAIKPDGTGWNIRVGLHSGPVVAGVVGIRKFAFDIWG